MFATFHSTTASEVSLPIFPSSFPSKVEILVVLPVSVWESWAEVRHAKRQAPCPVPPRPLPPAQAEWVKSR